MQPAVDDYPKPPFVGSNPAFPATFLSMEIMMKIPNTRTRGFTLIELMVVVCIIGILASIVSGFFQDKNGYEAVESTRPVSAKRVEDHPNLDNCKPLQDDNRVIYSCPDGKIYTE